MLRYFVEGVRTHLYANIKAHDPVNGYVEGVGMWIYTLTNKIGINDRMALHGVAELAANSLIIKKMGLTPCFDVSSEFRKYLFIMGLLEEVKQRYFYNLNIN